MLIEEVEALWSPIADHDDWTPLQAKLADIETMRQAYGFDPEREAITGAEPPAPA